MKKSVVIIVGLVMLGACQARFQKNQQVSFTYDDRSDIPVEIRKTAADTYLYAQLASNAYDWVGPNRHGATHFVLPSNVEKLDFALQPVDMTGNDDIGLAFVVYRIKLPKQDELVIAFRGSEPNWVDWWLGNVMGRQSPRAIAVFDALRSRYPDEPISVTGDSLGGSLATQVSLCRDVHWAVSINTSPRFSSKHCDDGVKENANRHSITERGEVLKVTRMFGREASQLYTSINCAGGFNPIKQHSAFKLAKCLTRTAAIDDGNAAKESIERNPAIFNVER